MRTVRNFTTALVLSIALPLAMLADIVSTANLTAGATLNLDAGTTGTSGGDLLWSGSSLSFQGNASGFFLGSAVPYASLTQATLSAFGAGLSKTPIPAAQLTTNSVIAVKTNAGNYAKLLVTSLSGTTLALQYTTYGANATPTGPTITGIQNNYSYILPGFPNYGIAPGALFIIKGALLSAPASPVLQDSQSANGIPLSLNSASITVTVNGVVTHPGIYYAIPQQIACVLPNGTPVGDGTVTVTNGAQTSQPFAIHVVTSALGLDTYYGSGTGLGVATNNVTGALYTYTNSIPPGATVVLWGSGLGATTDSDVKFASPPHAPNVPFQMYIGGIAVTPLYAGNSGYPGVNQINVTVPANVQTGCNVSFVGVSNNIVTNTVTLPIANGGGACSDPATGIDSSVFSQFANLTTVRLGILVLSHSVSSGTGGNSTSDSAAAIFESEPGGGTFSAASANTTTIGSCTVIQSVSSTSTNPITGTGLDAGSLSLTGSAGTVSLSGLPGFAGLYIAQLDSGFLSSGGGTYTFKGTGGANVGSLNVPVNYPPVLNWTNSSVAANFSRTAALPVNWTGGAPNTTVTISGSSSNTASGITASFTCTAPVAAQTFTVPVPVLLALPPGSGSVSVTNNGTFVQFNASGLDLGLAIASTSTSVSSTVN